MARNYLNDGSVISYKALSYVVSSQGVVVGTKLGVALDTIKAGDDGAVGLVGVWELPKLSSAVIAQGDALIWDVSAGQFIVEAPEVGDLLNCAFATEDAGDGTTTVTALLSRAVLGSFRGEDGFFSALGSDFNVHDAGEQFILALALDPGKYYISTFLTMSADGGAQDVDLTLTDGDTTFYGGISQSLAGAAGTDSLAFGCIVTLSDPTTVQVALFLSASTNIKLFQNTIVGNKPNACSISATKIA